MDTERVFETPDLYLSAALVMLLEARPAFKVARGKTIFCFPATDDLYRAMSIYNAGAPLNAIEYAETIKRLRAEMIMRRNREAGV
jgi:hypothetical protein